VLDLRQALRAELLEPANLTALAGRLSAGAPCFIHQALRPELAERLRGAPDPLPELESLFAAEGSRRLLTELSGVACDGALLLDRSRLGPGGHEPPRTGAEDGRGVALIWLATAGWDPAWGGQFCW